MMDPSKNHKPIYSPERYALEVENERIKYETAYFKKIMTQREKERAEDEEI
jgi:hypothetical protein